MNQFQPTIQRGAKILPVLPWALGLANDWPEPAPGDKKSTGCRYWPTTQFLAQASTGSTMIDEQVQARRTGGG